MRKERKIINTNIRLNLLDETDKKAWKYLQHMDRKKYKSYTKAVVIALNDYFARQEQLEKDPFLETRQKEEEFLKRVEEAIERGAKESMPLVLAVNLLGILQPALQNIADQRIGTGAGAGYADDMMPEEPTWKNQQEQAEQEEAEDAALDFADGF